MAYSKLTNTGTAFNFLIRTKVISSGIIAQVHHPEKYYPALLHHNII
ncbi:MAG: hypothetical protein IPI59_04005 [Sphingobacteriales bacterium]|jgi:hypothetical protein|nr:hypothetical protein [Sphingobacteriales bacterium]MBP9140266.1 hypothetical protein [Chitinophagales bacterium]MDA0197207.1 hypothetical protein [Bacteroidota bacterium]MBK6891452.1 hypothetical protein [Sphingobacteriales bacterium]MBK7526716.1 hypothetical protein [Sphingobacteriales bacterium]